MPNLSMLGTENMIEKFTNRELDILKKIIDGDSNEKISKDLKISVNTVKAHVSAIFTKMNVKNRVKAAIQAIKEGYFTD